MMRRCESALRSTGVSARIRREVLGDQVVARLPCCLRQTCRRLRASPAQDRVWDGEARALCCDELRLGGAFCSQTMIDRDGGQRCDLARGATASRPLGCQQQERHAIRAA